MSIDFVGGMYGQREKGTKDPPPGPEKGKDLGEEGTEKKFDVPESAKPEYPEPELYGMDYSKKCERLPPKQVRDRVRKEVGR